MSAPTKTLLLEPAAAQYAEHLRQLVRNLERTQDLMLLIADEHELVVGGLGEIEDTLARETQEGLDSRGIERSTRILSRVVRALRAGTVHLDSASASQSRFLETLRHHTRVVTELVTAMQGRPAAGGASRPLAAAAEQLHG